MFNSTFLTERQLEVYIRRKRGESLAKIAKELGTTRSNVCALEKAARRNIERAYNTIKLVESLLYKSVVTVPSGTDLYDIPGIIYRRADELGIKIQMSGPMLLKYIVEHCSDKLRNRQVLGEITIGIDQNGSIVVL
jgi:hypothetical protein